MPKELFNFLLKFTIFFRKKNGTMKNINRCEILSYQGKYFRWVNYKKVDIKKKKLS